MKKLIVLIAASALLAVSAHAEMGAPAFRLNALAGLNFANVKYTPDVAGWSAKGALSYGATVEFGMGSLISIETGLFMNKNKRDFSTTGLSFSLEQASMEVPLMARFHILPILDFGVGGYYETFDKKVTASNSSNTALVGNGDDTSGNQYDTYGVKAGVRARLPILPTLGFLVDASYKMGLKDTDKSSGTAKNSSYAAMAGLSIGF
jgi:hypothetical protein